MTVLEKNGLLIEPQISDQDIEMARIAQRRIMESIDHSRAAEITLIPSKRELSTVEAAHFMNISRPFIIKEIDSGRLKHCMVGAHRRIFLEDLIEYKNSMQSKQYAALERMVLNAKELGLDY